MDDLNGKVVSDNTLFVHVMGKQDLLGNRKDNGRRFVEFCSFHHRWYTEFIIRSAIRSALLDVHNKRGSRFGKRG